MLIEILQTDNLSSGAGILVAMTALAHLSAEIPFYNIERLLTFYLGLWRWSLGIPLLVATMLFIIDHLRKPASHKEGFPERSSAGPEQQQ